MRSAGGGGGGSDAIVVPDGSHPLGIRDCGPGRLAQGDRERLVFFRHAVIDHPHPDGRGPLPRLDGQRPARLSIVGPRRRGPVRGRVRHLHRLPARDVHRHREVRAPRTLVHRDVVDTQGRTPRRPRATIVAVVIADGADALVVLDGGAGRIGEAHLERLVLLLVAVVEHRHLDGRGPLAGQECQRPARARVVVAGGGRIGRGRVVDGHRARALGARGDGEHGRSAPLVHRGVADAKRWRRGRGTRAVVIADGADALVVLDGGALRIAQVHLERLVLLLVAVVDHRHLDGRGPLAGRECQRPARARVVAAGGGRIVRGLVVDGHRARALGARGDGEHGRAAPLVHRRRCEATASWAGDSPSSSRMVPTPSASSMVAPAGLVRRTLNVSSCSSSLSSSTVTRWSRPLAGRECQRPARARVVAAGGGRIVRGLVVDGHRARALGSR